MGFLKMTNNDSFLSSGKEIQSLISLITRKQFSPQREGARTTFPFERLTLFRLRKIVIRHFVSQGIDAIASSFRHSKLNYS